MDRTDSAFHETFGPEATPSCSATSSPVQGRKQILVGNSRNATERRPASERPNTTPRRSTEPHRKSLTTSSSNSARSRRRGHGSAPSSRRTSCTVIDPSRPKRHYRINSAQTCPTINRDIDDVLALHFRSCSLFQNSTYQSSFPKSTVPVGGPSVGAEIGATPGGSRPLASPHRSGAPVLDEKAGAIADVGEEDTIMQWMSPTTRKSQYDQIDRANSGLRGLLRRLMPRCVSGSGPQQFYEDEKSDVESVRRYRMDVSGEDDGVKSMFVLNMQRRKLQRSTLQPAERKKLFRFFGGEQARAQ